MQVDRPAQLQGPCRWSAAPAAFLSIPTALAALALTHASHLVPPCHFAAAKEQLLNLIEIAYLRAGLLDATPQQHGGLAAIEALLASKGRSISAAGVRGQQAGSLGACFQPPRPASRIHAAPCPLTPCTQSGASACRSGSAKRRCSPRACCASTAAPSPLHPTSRPRMPRSNCARGCPRARRSSTRGWDGPRGSWRGQGRRCMPFCVEFGPSEEGAVRLGSNEVRLLLSWHGPSAGAQCCGAW